ncbi:type IV pilin biogenesis protein [Planctomycetes bacterium CA13]|uniref:Type IV pilin biogenesis protein n=1 Tax=Novipirellula herctigrandis TaxID=2527986 RepID=A0A5C5Z663_9BACT|nr:type IV pilin biogenesis protein [Planctomycetes bacterium CA13]
MRASPIISLPERSLLRVLARCYRRNIDPAPLVAALAKEFSGAYGYRISLLSNRIAEGVPVVDAIHGLPGIVSPSVDAILMFANQSGTLSEAYQSLLDQDHGCKEEVGVDGESPTQMMLRVLASFFFALMVITFLLLFIMPTFEKMFDEFGLVLPAPTVLLIAVAAHLSPYIGLAILGVVLLLLIRSPVLASSLWNTWSLMSLGKKTASPPVQVRSLLASTIESGQSIETIVCSLSHVHRHGNTGKRLSRAVSRIEQGADGWTALAKSKVLCSREARALALTQSPDTQAWLLDWSASKRQSRRDRQRFAWTETLSLLLTLTLAIVVGWTAIAVFLPLCDLIWGLS